MSTVIEFLKTLSAPIFIVVAFCHTMLSLVLVPMPLKYPVASIPFDIAFYYWCKEMYRRRKLGFVHERVREIPQERIDKALEEIEQERAKTRQL